MSSPLTHWRTHVHTCGETPPNYFNIHMYNTLNNNNGFLGGNNNNVILSMPPLEK